jgi:hypothetical protein
VIPTLKEVQSCIEKETADVINSMGGEQDNVVFMGRKSFRMEIAAGPRSNELPIPIRGSTVPTEKIFEADRDRGWAATAAAALQPAKLKSSGTSVVALCATTFVLGIALTLTFTGRAAPRRAPVAAPSQPAQVAAPAQTAAQAVAPTATATPTSTSTMVVQPMPIAVPTDAEILAGFALAPSRRPLARPARPARPRLVRATQPAQSADADDSMVADPFADPAPAKPAAVKPATAKPAVAKPATAKAWVDPFAE